MNLHKTTLIMAASAALFLARTDAADKAAPKPAETKAEKPVEPKAAPRTLEEQVTALEGALTESIQQRDWRMLELAASGLKTAGLSGKDLEISILRAERNACWSGNGMAQQSRIEPWGLAARALAGDSPAGSALRKLANDVPVQPAVPDYKNARKDPAAFNRAQADYMKYSIQMQERDEALLLLALMKEPGVFAKVKDAISSVTPQANQTVFLGGGYGASALITAAVIADKEQGLKAVIDYANDEKGALDAQINALNGIQSLQLVRTAGYSEFSVEAEAAAALPKNTYELLGKPVSSLIVRYGATDRKEYDNTLSSLINIASQLPAKALTKEAAQALSDTCHKINPQYQQWIKLQIDEILKKNGLDPNTAAKPPAPPGDF